MHIPNSWADRKAAELLQEAAPQNFDKPYVYFACCVNLKATRLAHMVEGGKEITPEYAISFFRNHCAGFDKWEDVMGYVRDPNLGLTLPYDWSLSYFTGKFEGAPCLWIDHSRIEYIWVKRIHYPALLHYINDIEGPHPAGVTPAERAKLRASAKHVSFSWVPELETVKKEEE